MLLRYFLLLLLCVPVLLTGQIKFDPLQLNDEKKNGPAIAAALNTIEVYEYSDTNRNCVYLKNGFRSAKFENEKEWLKLKDSATVYRIDIVYSKYPLREGVYHEIYPLLFKRLRTLFEMDPGLNSSLIQWNKVLQTHCLNDAQVNKLFHGVVLWYRLPSHDVEEPEIAADTTVAPEEDSVAEEELREANLVSEQNSAQDVLQALNEVEHSDIISDSLRWALKKKSVRERARIIKTQLAKKIETDPETDLKKASKSDLDKYDKEITKFLKRYPVRDSVVKKVLDRHPEWKNVIVINDWTGSMYGYGAQVLQWHLLNFERSGIKSLTLFNDGDDKSQRQKKIGETGGIYSTKADNITKLVHLFNFIMMKGGGGDGPENDIEGILEAQKLYPDYTDIILIADNNACARDIELATKIGKPVKVIICGYNPVIGVNPDYVYLAKVTGGGLYTIEEDIENISATVGEKGKVISLLDKRFKLMSSERCEGSISTSELDGDLFSDYSKAAKKKRRVHRLKLSKQSLAKVPRGVYRMTRLYYLDLSDNYISEVSEKIGELEYLRTLKLGDNKISTLPPQFAYLFYLEELDLSRNYLKEIPAPVAKLKHIVNLDLSHNKIQTLGKRFSLKTLITFSLAENEIKELSNDIGKLKELKTLDLSKNQLSALPENIVGLPKLKELNLANNNLDHLPNRLSRLTKLRVLHLEGNPIPEKEKARIMSLLPKTEIYF